MTWWAWLAIGIVIGAILGAFAVLSYFAREFRW